MNQVRKCGVRKYGVSRPPVDNTFCPFSTLLHIRYKTASSIGSRIHSAWTRMCDEVQAFASAYESLKLAHPLLSRKWTFQLIMLTLLSPVNQLPLHPSHENTQCSEFRAFRLPLPMVVSGWTGAPGSGERTLLRCVSESWATPGSWLPEEVPSLVLGQAAVQSPLLFDCWGYSQRTRSWFCSAS